MTILISRIIDTNNDYAQIKEHINDNLKLT